VLVHSRARVLLLGIGADEQLAGYGRHRTSFRHGGWQGLADELRLDAARLWRRNLGRDDRVCSDHGKEVRLPFLDEAVGALVRSVPLPLLADLSLPHGVGDKRVLRVAGRMLGLGASTCLVKRAIHFGTRIAKQSNIVNFGSNRAARGDVEFSLTSVGPPR
jgi:asparagine synthetase B (glutamine-hydrolysing)